MREFENAVDRIRGMHPGLQLSWRPRLTIPGTSTDEHAPVVRAAIEAWELLEGRDHVPIVANSGATDANILRQKGLPTARIGMNRIGPDAPLPLDFSAGMNIVDIREAARLTRHLVLTVVTLENRHAGHQDEHP